MADQSVSISRTLLTDIVTTNEVGNMDNAYKLFHAGTANSGFSVGALQLDLAHQPSALETVDQFLVNCGAFTANDLDAIRHALTLSGNPQAISDALKSGIDAQFATDPGQSMIDGLDAKQLVALLNFVKQAYTKTQENPRYVSDMAFKAFCDSDLLKALIGDNANQFGPPNTLGDFFKGDMVTVGGAKHQLGDAAWDFQAFATYEASYKYVQSSAQGARDIRRRRTNIIDILDAQGLLDHEDTQAYLAIIQATYQSEG